MIRIIAGTYKGRFLKVPDSKVTRPTMDKVRQAMFNVIRDKSIHAVTLDLFAGSGAMGLEAISRGAKKVYFVDKDRGTFQVLKENIQSLQIDSSQYETFLGDYRVFIKRSSQIKFDLVFLDPPYRMNINNDIILDMDKRGLFAKDCLIVSEQEYPNKEIEGFEMKEYRYGQKHVAVYRKED